MRDTRRPHIDRHFLATLAILAACAPDAQQATFDDEVVPVLERGCLASTCHGVSPGAIADGEVIDWSQLYISVDEQGHIEDTVAARRAVLRNVNTVENPAYSTLLRKTIDPAWGGLPHFGPVSFRSPEDEDYRAILRWIASEESGGEDPEPLSELELQYKTDVQPLLAGLGCMLAGCHGLNGSVPFHLDPGFRGEFPIEATRANRLLTLSMVALDGDSTQSRLLRKSLPLHDGGIVHKGGNTQFLTSTDRRVKPIRDWICAERKAVSALNCGGPSASGIVFVRGPVEMSDPFDADGFLPGTDLYLAIIDNLDEAPAVVNLTAGLHDEPADIRDPAVDPSGQRVLFSMRRSADDGHEIWELDLETLRPARLVDSVGELDGGGMAHHRDPTYGPDGLIWFTSTQPGTLAHGGDRLDTELYSLDPATSELVRRSFTPNAERKPVFFVTGEDAAGEVGFSVLRDAVPDKARAHIFRFPPSLTTEYRTHFGVTPPETQLFDMRELPDGRFVVVVGELGASWGGRLAVVERTFGPALRDDWDEPTVPTYSEPMVRLDPDATSMGWTDRVYRDPVVLPDGRIVAAVAEGPLELEDPDANPDFSIQVITLSESIDGSGPIIAERQLLVDMVGVADTDPEPVVVRVASLAGYEHADSNPQGVGAAIEVDPSVENGWFIHQGYATLDAVIGNLAPAGTKVPSEIRTVRFVEAIETTPAERAAVPPDATPDGRLGATTVTLGGHPRARILGEVPLAPDGSFSVELPSGIAVRLQGLDDRGIAVGTIGNRWFDINPGQTLRQGVQPQHFEQLCGVCHGSLSGQALATGLRPDMVTTASLALARYDNANPRRPLAPTVLGDATRIEIDFRDDVQPILDAACVGCHGPTDPAAQLSLSDDQTEHYTVAYETLLTSGLVDEPNASADRSRLVELLLGTERHGDLTPEEARVLTRWIELGATFR